MRNKGRVTFLTTGLRYGGAERQVADLAIALRGRGWSTRVISMTPVEQTAARLPRSEGDVPVEGEPELAHRSALADELRRAGVPVSSLAIRPSAPDPRAILRLAGELRRDRPLILHSHMVHANLLARMTRILCRVPVQISTAHNISEGARWLDVAYRLTDGLCTITTNVSQTAVDRYIASGAVPRGKIRLVYNAVDTNRYYRDLTDRERARRDLGLGVSEFVWLKVARLVQAKDHANLVKALAMLRPEPGAARLLLIGIGPLEGDIRRLINEYGLGSHVDFLGARADVARFMNAADGYVQSSAWEGLPLVLLEAAACGLPIVATDVGGNGEVVHDDQTGYLVPPHNPEALAVAMARLMALPASARAGLGEAGVALIRTNYALERVVDQWEALYTELLISRRASIGVDGAAGGG